MMTDAPDPGLTDLIATHYRTITTAVIYRDDESDGAHRKGFECVCACGDEYMASTRAGDRTEATVLRRADSEHVALVVEQHTNGRIAEVEHWKARSQYNYDCGMVLANEANARAEKAEATIARVITALEAAEKSVPDDWGVTYIYTSQLRAALEGEQQ